MVVRGREVVGVVVVVAGRGGYRRVVGRWQEGGRREVWQAGSGVR